MSVDPRDPVPPVAPSRAQLTECRVELAECGVADGSRAVVALLADLWRWGAAAGRGSRPIRRPRRPGLALVPELAEPLAAVDAALRAAPGRPGASAEAGRVVQEAASRIEALGAIGTAWAFATAAVMLDPDEPRHAAAVGRLERGMERYAAAAQWFVRAARLADRGHRPADATAALIALAGTAEDQEHHSLAGRLLTFAARYARHRHVPSGEGDALLALGLLRHGLGYTRDAHTYFGDAVLAYETDRARLLHAGLEIGRCWLDEGEFVSSMKLYLVLLPEVSDPLTAMSAAARLTRAAAAAACERVMEEWWLGTIRYLGMAPIGRASAEALLDLARAAGTCGLSIRAQVAAEGALALAREVGDSSITSAAARIMAVTSFSDVPDDVARAVFPDRRDSDEDNESLCVSPALEPLFNAITAGLRSRRSDSRATVGRRR